MMRLNSLLSLSVLAALFAFAAPLSFAADETGAANPYKFSGKTGQRGTGEENFIDVVPPDDYRLHFVRLPARTNYEQEHQATLRLSVPVAMNGCMIVTPPEYEESVRGRVLYVELEKFRVDIDTSARYAHYECDSAPRPLKIDIPLDARKLMLDGVEKITFRGKTLSDTYKVEASTDKLSLVPESSLVFQPADPAGRFDPLTHWFYPDNTVILFVPGAKSGQNFREQIMDLASTAGLKPVEDALEGFVQPLKDRNSAYFVDKSGQVTGGLDGGGTAFFGKVTASENFLGPDGMEEHKETLDVYARLPGLLE